MKEAVHRLRNQLRRKTKKPSTISVLKAAKQEIDVSQHRINFLSYRSIISLYPRCIYSGPRSPIPIPRFSCNVITAFHFQSPHSYLFMQQKTPLSQHVSD